MGLYSLPDLRPLSLPCGGPAWAREELWLALAKADSSGSPQTVLWAPRWEGGGFPSGIEDLGRFQ